MYPLILSFTIVKVVIEEIIKIEKYLTKSFPS